MDVTFTNVLEGARQYFQGLPTASCSTANSSYATGNEHQNGHYAVEQQNQERTPSTTSYWPPHQEPQLRPPTRERSSTESLQRPPSHQSDTSRPSSHNQLPEQLRTSITYHTPETSRPASHNQTNSQLSEQLRTPSTYHAQEQSIPTSHSFQFTRPHSREVHQQHVPQQQQYQPHIHATSSTPQQNQTRTPTAMQSQVYHQMQQSQSHLQPQAYANYQQSRPYYPAHTQAQPQQPQSYHHMYPVASSQTYSQPQESSYVHQSYPTHSQNSYSTDSSYTTTKAVTPHTQDVSYTKENSSSHGATAQQNQQNTQPYRTTHNLPPIAALSSLNYHSSRSSREVMRIANNKVRTTIPTTPTSSNFPAKPTIDTLRASIQYPLQNNHNDYTNSIQQNRVPVSQPYQYASQVSSQPNTQFSSSVNMTVQSSQHQPSSSHSNYQAQQLYPNPEVTKTYQPSNSKVIPQSTANISNNTAITSVIKQKRESPLDLSVKTVRTSADSTLDDTDVHTADAQRIAKYYQTGKPPVNSPMQAAPTYPTCDIYANSFQRNLTTKTAQFSNSGAPKVDFLPNFNVSTLTQTSTNKVDARHVPAQTSYNNTTQRQFYDKKNVYHNPLVNSVPVSAHSNSSSVLQSAIKKPLHGLPRIDFLPPTHQTSSMYAVPSNDTQRKRISDQTPTIVPNKITKIDTWRQTIDQQIDQRLSSYAKSRLQQEHAQKQQSIPNKQLVNGNYTTAVSYQRPQYNTVQTPHIYTSTNHYSAIQTSHSQTYVPTPAAHQYPGYTSHASQQQQQQQQPSLPPPSHHHQQQQQQTLYSQHSLTRTNSNPSLPIANANKITSGAADRRVLSLLRNSLEIKGAKEAQKKLEQEQHKPQPRSDVQQPSTDVMAPLQPKPGLVGRHNMSPFAATSLFERNSNTPPTYKFHLPKAIDSIKFDSEMTKERIINKQADSNTIANSNTDLDGLAAFLAARIRTKAELKQVGPMQNLYNSNTESNLIRSSNEVQVPRPTIKQNIEHPPVGNSNGESPPKLTKEKSTYLPRRRLFSRNEEDLNGASVNKAPPRDKSGLRSSSETSVFDFPDSDSETEMPVLERQSLVDMRRDRKTYPKPPISNEISTSSINQFDLSFDDACDKFVEQLKGGIGKKRGRRKKVIEPDVIAKLETVVKETPTVIDIKQEIDTPNEKSDFVPVDIKPFIPKVESDSDSDVPLIKCKGKTDTVEDNSSKDAFEQDIKNVEVKLEISSSNGGDLVKSKSKVRKNNNKSVSTIKKVTQKPQFGDGNDFQPGWEEHVYNYKRSLRMPASLIHVTRPPQWNRLSISLPDLDPCPCSPSENIDNSKAKVKIESMESDLDSNSNLSTSFAKNLYDAEESSESVKSKSLIAKSKGTSILDRLMERCGARKRKKVKKKNEVVPKIIQKSGKALELLPTPGVDIETLLNSKKEDSSILLGFRKKTIDNFKDTFKNSPSLFKLDNQFKSVILKSRTRTQSRVLKQRDTIKEVFGEDRPASAPPVTCVDNTPSPELDNKASVLENTKKVLKNKLLNRGKKTSKKALSGYVHDNVIKRDFDSKSETPSVDGEDYSIPAKKRIKNIRRKFSSGFDYIRKKKKQVKKEGVEAETTTKPKRRGAISKTTPESVQDIQKEVKMWVLNKGIGETHLHRAARLGYTDITAYCLEKMDSSPSPKDNAGYTPLHEACARGHLNIAKLLLQYGANVTESAQGGIRPLHEAAENGFVEIVRLLLSYGADPMLATYSGLTPLSLATDEITINLLQNHIADIKGEPSTVWNFYGPALCFDPEENGYNPLDDAPGGDPPDEEEEENIDFECSELQLPNLYTIRGEPATDKWVLLQDLLNILKIKSRDALLRQICPPTPSTSASTSSTNYKSVLRELKMSDFLEQARCCQYMCAGEKVNTRASKIALVKYTDKVKELLGVDNDLIPTR